MFCLRLKSNLVVVAAVVVVVVVTMVIIITLVSEIMLCLEWDSAPHSVLPHPFQRRRFDRKLCASPFVVDLLIMRSYFLENE